MVFNICQVNGEFRLVYMPTLTEYETVYGADPNKHNGLVDDPIFTIERFENVFNTYEQQNPSNIDNLATTAGQDQQTSTSTADEEFAPPDLTLLWIVGGAVLLIGGVLTVILVIKGKA